MTKRLSPEEKKRRKKERREAKKKEKTQAAIPQAPKLTGNLCDDCAYEFGECEGVPKFAQEEGANDRVVECPAFVNVASMPTADKKPAPGPAAAKDEKPWDIALKRLDEFGKSILNSRAEEIREEAESYSGELPDILVHIVTQIIKREGGPTDGLVHETEGPVEEIIPEEQAATEAEREARRKHIQRFHQEEDFGTCQVCGQPLKRTAYNRERDAIRCVNGRCRQYRFIMQTIPTGI